MKKDTVLVPLRGYALIEPLDEDQTSSQGLSISSEQQGRQAKGRVITVSSEYPIDDVFVDWEIGEGDIVWFRRYQGEEATHKGKKYLFVKYSDILGVYR